MSLIDACEIRIEINQQKKHYLLIGIQNKKMYLCMVKSRYLPRLLYNNIIEYLKVNIYGLRNWKRLYRMRYMYR